MQYTVILILVFPMVQVKDRDLLVIWLWARHCVSWVLEKTWTVIGSRKVLQIKPPYSAKQEIIGDTSYLNAVNLLPTSGILSLYLAPVPRRVPRLVPEYEMENFDIVVKLCMSYRLKNYPVIQRYFYTQTIFFHIRLCLYWTKVGIFHIQRKLSE